MKIGIDGRAANWYRGTGIGTYTYQLINNLNKVDSENNYLLFMSERCNIDIKLEKKIMVKNITINKKDNFWDEVNIPNIISDNNLELYHVPQNGVGLPEEKRCPFIITLHDIIPITMPETVGEVYLKIFNEKMPSIVSSCDGILTVSEFSKQDIVKAFNYPKEKVYVTYLAPEKIYKPMNKTKCKNNIKEKYSIQDDFILYVGGFSPRKNIVGLIEAFSLFIKKYKDTKYKNIKLIITGNKGKSYDLYKKRAEELSISESIIFTGFIPLVDLPYFYNASSLVVYPSLYEGFGLPPIEAMACGVPVITSNVTSIPEITKGSAYLINPLDRDELSFAIYKCLSDEILRDNLIVKGLIKASELSWEKTARETLNAYKKIAE